MLCNLTSAGFSSNPWGGTIIASAQQMEEKLLSLGIRPVPLLFRRFSFAEFKGQPYLGGIYSGGQYYGVLGVLVKEKYFGKCNVCEAKEEERGLNCQNTVMLRGLKK